MSSINFKGPYTSGSKTGIWHGYTWVSSSDTGKYPVMSASGTLSATRSGSTISGSVSASSTKVAGYFGYPTWVYVYAHTSEKSWQVASKKSPVNDATWSTSFDFSLETNSAVTLTVVYHCADSANESSNCSLGYSYVTMDGSLYFDEYNPYTAPTAPTSCTVNVTKVKPDGSLSVTWNGEDGGTYRIL